MAETWTDANGVTYEFGTNGDNACISRIHNCPKNLIIPDIVYDGTTPYTVTEIGYANYHIFNYEDPGVKTISMPKTVIAIGENTFRKCKSLKTVEIPAKQVGACSFYGCTSLQNVVLSGPITTISEGLFQDCGALLKINLPSTITTIQTNAFLNCNSLEINVPSSVTSIGENAFNGSNIIHIAATTPPTLVSNQLINSKAIIFVPESALNAYQTAPYWSDFADRILSESTTKQREVTVTAASNLSALHTALGLTTLTNIVSLKVNGTINSYDIMLIRNKMINLKYLDLSNASVVANSYEYYTGYCTHDNVLEDYAFSELDIKVLHLPKNLISIQNCCANCPYLDTVYCQSGLRTIGDDTFDNCPNLRCVNIKEGVTDIGRNAFSETRQMESIILPNSLEKIGEGAFYNTGLTTLTIPANVTEMGQSVFASNVTENIGYDNCWHAGKYYICWHCGGGSLKQLTFAKGAKLKRLPQYAFMGQDKLESVTWANGLDTIGNHSMAYCTSLVNRQFPENLKFIDGFAFRQCTSLDTIVLPPHLETIESYAFAACLNMDVIKISSSVRNINNYAFTSCPNVSRVYTYTVEPTNILQQTFDCYKVANLYVPRTSYMTYFYNTQWSQFVKLIEFDEAYDYFYLNGDYELGGEHGTIEGNPDVDINPGGGLIIYGDSTLNFGDITITGTPETGSSIISDDNIDIDTLRLNLLESKDKWHFLTFPFNIKREDVKCRSEFVIRYYDGDIRAKNGSGGWQNTPVGKELLNAQGYIFQPKENDTLQLVFEHPKFPTTDVSTPLYLYAPADPTHTWDANWNLVGNPYMSYYDLDSIMHSGFNYPVICWNGTGYDTYRPGDDHYHFLPFEAFFVQNAKLTQMTFPISGRETRIQANKKLYGDDKQPSAAPARQAYTCTQNDGRQMINLALSDDTYTDRTRVVFNATATTSYEIGTDAVKFFAGNPSPVQLYTIGAQNEEYSINERPATTNGEVIRIGYYAPQAGMLTLSAARMDTTISIYDNELHREVDLAAGDYTFYSEAGHNRTRFSLAAKAPAITTSLDDLSEAEAADMTVYTTTGVLVAEHAALEDLHLAAGVYLVKTNMGTKKIVVR